MASGDNAGPGTIEVIKESAHRILRTFANMPVSANGIAIDSRTRTVLAAGTDNHFLVISEVTGKILRTIRMNLRGFVAQFTVRPTRP